MTTETDTMTALMTETFKTETDTMIEISTKIGIDTMIGIGTTIERALTTDSMTETKVFREKQMLLKCSSASLNMKINI